MCNELMINAHVFHTMFYTDLVGKKQKETCVGLEIQHPSTHTKTNV